MALKTYSTLADQSDAMTKFKNDMNDLISRAPNPSHPYVNGQFAKPLDNVRAVFSEDHLAGAWDILIILDNGEDTNGDDLFLLALSKKIPHALQAYYTATQTKANVCLFSTSYKRKTRPIDTGSHNGRGRGGDAFNENSYKYNDSIKYVSDVIGVQTSSSSQTWYKPAQSSYQNINIPNNDIIDAMAKLLFSLTPSATYLTNLPSAPTLSQSREGIDSLDDIKTIKNLKGLVNNDICSMTTYVNI